MVLLGHLPPTKIEKAIESKLRPADLRLSNGALIDKLNRIGDGGDLFEIRAREPQSSEDFPHLMRVSGSQEEIVVFIHQPSEQTPRIDYWIGVRRGRIVAQVIPNVGDPMIGPMYGEWRRSGPYLLGAGEDYVYHSMNWADAEFDVFRETSEGIRVLQREEVDSAAMAPYFRSPTDSNVIATNLNEQGDLKTLNGRKFQDATHERIWRFRDGRYRLVASFTVRNTFWAIDRLLTAILHHENGIVRQMIPDARLRAKLVPLMKAAYAAGCDMVSDGDRPNEATFFASNMDKRGPVLQFEKRRGRWIVVSYRTTPLKD